MHRRLDQFHIAKQMSHEVHGIEQTGVQRPVRRTRSKTQTQRLHLTKVIQRGTRGEVAGRTAHQWHETGKGRDC